MWWLWISIHNNTGSFPCECSDSEYLYTIIRAVSCRFTCGVKIKHAGCYLGQGNWKLVHRITIIERVALVLAFVSTPIEHNGRVTRAAAASSQTLDHNGLQHTAHKNLGMSGMTARTLVLCSNINLFIMYMTIKNNVRNICYKISSHYQRSRPASLRERTGERKQ